MIQQVEKRYNKFIDPTQLKHCSLPPCLCFYQFNVDVKEKN